MKLYKYYLVVMENTSFKFQLDQAHYLAAGIICFLCGFFHLFIYLLISLTWLDLDGFEGGEVAAEMQILSRFLLMTLSFIFPCLGSF